MRITSRLLKQQPKNPYIKGRLMQEFKNLKKLRRLKRKQYVNQVFTELDQLHSSNPKGYMDLVKSMRDGSFDKKVSDATSHVSPENWKAHFQGLIGPEIVASPAEDKMTSYIEQNYDSARSSLDRPFTRPELLSAISTLKNNKAICLD